MKFSRTHGNLSQKIFAAVFFFAALEIMELNYIRVPVNDLLGTAAVNVIQSPYEDSEKRDATCPERLRRYIISSLRKFRIAEMGLISLGLFFISFTCFIFTLLSLFTGGDLFFDYPDGYSRVVQERDHWKSHAASLQSRLDRLNISSYH